MSFSVNEAGEMVELQEVPVDETEKEAELQEELDEAQNELNVHNSNLSNAEEALAAAEAQADAANQVVLEARTAKEAADARVTKSVLRRQSWEAAKQLRAQQLEQAASAGNDKSSSDESEESAESEEVAIPVSVATAEG
jgi:chromosome segregation ATPase